MLAGNYYGYATASELVRFTQRSFILIQNKRVKTIVLTDHKIVLAFFEKKKN